MKASRKLFYTLFYSLCLGVIGCAVFFSVQWLLLGGLPRRSLLASLAGLAAVILLVRPLDRFLTQWTSRLFFREKRRYHQALRAASGGMGRIRNLPRLLRLITRMIVGRVRVSHATIFLADSENKAFVVVASRGRSKQPVRALSLKRESPLVLLLQQRREPLVYSVLRRNLKRDRENPWKLDRRLLERACAEMEQHQAEVCIPSFSEGKLRGFLALGRKLSGEPYDEEDLSIFSALASQASMAIENAQAYEELRDTRDQLLQSERLNTIGKFAADMAHEIKNPLQAIMTYFELLPEKYDDPEFRDRFAKLAKAEAERINELVRELATYTNPRPPRFQWVGIGETADSVLVLLENELRKHRIEVRRGYSPNLTQVEADRDQMKQVFLNLFMNAIDAMASNHGEKNQLEVIAFPSGNVQIFKVRDTGHGISEKQMSALFTPFFTTKERGSGLGLSIVQNILRAHNATIDVESRVNEGTTITVTLPRRQPQTGLSAFTLPKEETADADRPRG